MLLVLPPVSDTGAVNLPPVSTTPAENFATGGKFCHRYQQHQRQILPLVSTTPEANFDTGINDTGGKFYHQFRLCCGHWWQICHHFELQISQQIFEKIRNGPYGILRGLG